MKLALIGGGNMGGALLKALVKSNTLAASDTLLIEPDSGKRESLVRETGCRAKASMDDEIAKDLLKSKQGRTFDLNKLMLSLM